MTQFWRDKRVLVTGHTGFKGAWLCELLLKKGAQVFGLALETDPETKNLFDQLILRERVDHAVVDLRDLSAVEKRVSECQPEIIFHLAAQSLVKTSYRLPVETWMTNLMGSVHLMKSLSDLDKNVSLLIATTDKVYENKNIGNPFTELDRLGASDPYSASKAGVELAAESWRVSFNNLRICTARAGNVIGGGDWAENRIIPDLARAFTKGEALELRNPNSTRPFQHVLDPLSGYLMLAEKLTSGDDRWQSAFNFGPDKPHSCTVKEIVEIALETWSGTWRQTSKIENEYEASKLELDCSKSHEELGWYPRWNLDQSVRETVSWYKAICAGTNPKTFTDKQIEAYEISV